MISMMFLKLSSKRAVNAFQFLCNQIVIQSCFFTPAIMMGRLGVIPSNTQGFPVFMKRFSKTVDFSLKESFSKQFIKYPSLFTSYPNTSFIHITREISAIGSQYCQLVSKIPILPCSLSLWAFCFSFYVFEIAVYQIE